MVITFWQAAYAAGPAVSFLKQNSELTHVTLHWQAEAHHHAADGAIHVDDSQDSMQHVMTDCTHHNMAVIASAALAFIEPPSQGIAEASYSLLPPPVLDGLRRPPRSLT